MSLLNKPRIKSRLVRTAGVAAALTCCAAAVPPAAPASVSAKLEIAAELVNQPVGRPWSVNLLVGAVMTESTGEEFMPITTALIFQFPHATLNADKFPTCKATDGQLLTRGYQACPSGSQIGSGTAHVRAIALPFDATFRIFNGKGTNAKRELIIWAIEPTTQVTVVLRGTLRKINRGQFGFEFNLKVPPIQILTDQFVAIVNFKAKVGKRIKKNGRTISYIEAPTKCTGEGWPFTYRNELRDGSVATDQTLIPCVLRAR
jgi:hypothetical protein